MHKNIKRWWELYEELIRSNYDIVDDDWFTSMLFKHIKSQLFEAKIYE